MLNNRFVGVMIASFAGALAGMMISAAPAMAGMSPKQVYKSAGPAVVLLLGSDNGRAGSGGTGSIVTSEGKVITNAHVVISEATGQPYKILYVFLKPPKLTGDNKRDLVNRYKARVLSFSAADKLDLAVLQIENPPPNLPTIAFADPDQVEIGDDVVAIGHPESGGLWTLTTGAVSTVIANFNRVSGKHVFQTEASVNRGNSGGPLLNDQAQMVGINTAIARTGAGGVTITDVNFSLKSSVAVSWMAGQGMGLAYAPKKNAEMIVAVAPVAQSPIVQDTVAAAAPANPAEPTAPPKPLKVREAPVATIVVAHAPPAKPYAVREEGKVLATKVRKEKVQAGKKLDIKKARPKTHTKKRPYSLDDLRKKQMKELEDMMNDMSGRSRKKNKGMGLW